MSCRLTVALRRYPYDRENTKKTETKYCGSFPLGLDPSAIPTDGEVRPGERRYGISLRPQAPFPLHAEDLAYIRDWLRKHGLFERHAAEERAARSAAAAAREQERVSLLAEMERVVRASVEAEVSARYEAQRAAARQNPLDALEAAFAEATREVACRAADLKSQGQVLGRQRDWRKLDEVEDSPLDALWRQTSRIRLEVMVAFEDACQDAGLMARRKTARHDASGGLA